MHSLQETIWENISGEKLKDHMQGKYFRLKEWPNFGFSRYSPDFIVLSANLTKRTMNKQQLMDLINTDESIVDHFLNAAYLLQIIEISEESQQVHIAKEPASNFINKLKTLFGF